VGCPNENEKPVMINHTMCIIVVPAVLHNCLLMDTVILDIFQVLNLAYIMHIYVHCVCVARCYGTSIIPVHGRQRQEDCEF
jgi:hypothetical protein